ncbi:MAG TPA: hypothetical protein VHO02_04195, partial [Fibrobacteria bacterium]|nr:hypothetical protein [Fibrobacteria bacterium]
MSAPHLSDLLDTGAFPDFAALEPAPGRPVHVAGLAGSAPSALVAAQFRKRTGPLLYLAADAKDADSTADDLAAWLGDESVLRFPGLDLKPYEWRLPFGRVREARLEAFEALYRCAKTNRPVVLVTTAAAFLERFQSPRELHREIVALRPGDALDPSVFREAAAALGFREETVVQDIGDFSVRGEILDVYPFLANNPIRIVLDGDRVESIREFDIFSQRSIREVTEVSLLPQDECCYTDAEIEAGLLEHLDALGGEDAYQSELHRLTRKRDLAGIHWQKAFFKKLDHTLLDFLGSKAGAVRVVVGDSEGLARAVEKTWEAARTGYSSAREAGRLVNPPEELLLQAKELHRLLDAHPTVHIGRVAWEGPGSAVFSVEPQRRAGAGLGDAEPLIRGLAGEGLRIWLTCPNPAQAERLRKAAAPLGVEDVLEGNLASGFVDRTQGVAVLTDHQ